MSDAISGPLAGVRILDLTRLLPGAYCTLVLADLGAEVVKIEEPVRGDYMREMPPSSEGVGAYHRALNRGKRSVALDLRTAEGRDALLRMGVWADALVESFRPGVLHRLGVGTDALRERNPRLVTCAITGYGQDGPYRDRAGHDLNYLGVAGVLALTGEENGPPVIPGVQVADLAGGMAAAIGLVACLHEAARTGRGRAVDASLFDAAVSWLAIGIPQHLATGRAWARGQGWLTGGLACYRLYPARDGKWLAVGALEPRFWKNLCDAIGRPELADRQFEDAAGQRELSTALGQVFAARSRDEWIELLGEADACVSPVNDLGEALSDPHVLGRGLIANVDGEAVGPATPVRVSGSSLALVRAPDLGEHTSEVLQEAGLSRAEIDRLSSGSDVRPPR